jgi:NAD-dependent SIR2 family protein deacetylase
MPRRAGGPSAFESLQEFVARHRRLFVLTGAGCSTGSGIPDYRDANGEWKRVARPVTLQAFLGDERARKHYWARSLVGWKRMGAARPNDAHRSLATLEHMGRIEQLVTQNVDGLHEAAGSRNVIDLHGRVDVVRCMSCAMRLPREHVQSALIALNSGSDFAAADAPDGDADLENVDFAAFDVPTCNACGGVLKPDVVFFGESVPKDRVAQAMAALERADAMLVVGSSLMVYSGYRFARRMAEIGKPIAAINLGRTRADCLLALKVAERCADALAFVANPSAEGFCTMSVHASTGRTAGP